MNWGDMPQHGPVMLAWAVFRFVTMEAEQGQVLRLVIIFTWLDIISFPAWTKPYVHSSANSFSSRLFYQSSI